MKTKLFTLFFALVASVGTMFAESGTCGENLTWDLTNGILTISGTGDMYNYDSYNNGRPWYIHRKNISQVVMNNGITSIGNYAFYDCTNLTSIDIPNSVTNIGEGAFENDSNLVSVTIPSSVTSIGYKAFYECEGLTAVYISDLAAWCNISFASKDADPSGSASNPLIYGCNLYINNELVTSLVIPNSITSIRSGTFCGCNATSINIPNSVTSIGDYAFQYCLHLTSLTLGSGVKSIGDHAFAYCAFYFSHSANITCYAEAPPQLVGSQVFYSSSIDTLFVPAGSLSAYKASSTWNDFIFKTILPIGAKGTETNDVRITPSDNSIYVEWPAVSGAATYELEIKDKSGNVICKLIFNSDGQLTSIAFNAPGRNAAQQTQGAGFAFTINSLSSGVSYDLIFTAKDSNGVTLRTKTVSFTTTDGTQGLNDINAAAKSQKIIRDGQVLIQRGDKTYTLEGVEVK